MDTSKLNFAYLVTVSDIRTTVTISKVGTDNTRQTMSNIGFQSEEEAREYFNERIKSHEETLSSSTFKLLNKYSTKDWVVFTFMSEENEVYQYQRIIEITRLPFKFI